MHIPPSLITSYSHRNTNTSPRRLSGFLPAILSPDWFTHEQLSSSSPLIAYPIASRTTTRQLGNMYFLAFLVGVGVLYSSSEIRVVKNYLIALWVADLGHMMITAEALGWEGTMNVSGWNAMTWGNLGVTVSLFEAFFILFFWSNPFVKKQSFFFFNIWPKRARHWNYRQ